MIRIKNCREARKKLGGKVVRIKVNTGEGGKLFGSVTTAQIAEALAIQFSVPVDKKDLKMERPSNRLANTGFKAKLYAGVEAFEANIKVKFGIN